MEEGPKERAGEEHRMEQPHSIRLQGPWQCASHSSTDSAEAEATIHCRDSTGLVDFLGESFSGQLRLGRRFQRPTGITSNSQVRLVIKASLSPDVVGLNDHKLAAQSAIDEEIRDRLEPGNQLQLTFTIRPENQFPGLLDLFTATLQLK